MIRPVRREDAAAICGIYNYYIENTSFTFEEIPLSEAEMEERIENIIVKYPWLVMEEAGEVMGYAYVHAWRERASYRFSAELSVYLKNGFQGKGRGGELLGKLLEELRKSDIHALVAGIALPNEKSIGMVEKFGFRKIGQFREIGYKHGIWRDVGYWELILSEGVK